MHKIISLISHVMYTVRKIDFHYVAMTNDNAMIRDHILITVVLVLLRRIKLNAKKGL